MSEHPWTFEEAVQRCQHASRAQQQAEDAVRKAVVEAAVAEEAYRLELAAAIVSKHADGIAWSVCADVARGEKRVAELRRRRDIAAGVRDALSQSVWRRSADRKDAQRFSDWSQRVQLADGSIASGNEPVYAGTRAA